MFFLPPNTTSLRVVLARLESVGGVAGSTTTRRAPESEGWSENYVQQPSITPLRCRIGRLMRAPRAIVEPGRAFHFVPTHPRGSRLPTDAVLRRELGHRRDPV
jgi:hypothetical protein